MPTRIENGTEVYSAGEPLPARDPWIYAIARLMDGAIPIGRWSIGLDPLLGLIPGIGDLIGAFFAMVIVLRAVQAGIPRIAVARMMANIAIDTLVGSIPVFGDAFDFAFKSNMKNLRIYEASMAHGHADTARHWFFFLMLFLLVGALVTGIVYGMIAFYRAIRL